MGRPRKNRIYNDQTIRVSADIPARDFKALLKNLPGRYRSIADFVRSAIRAFNAKCEEEEGTST